MDIPGKIRYISEIELMYPYLLELYKNSDYSNRFNQRHGHQFSPPLIGVSFLSNLTCL